LVDVEGDKWCYIKMHKSGKDVVVALCDEDLLGRSLRAGRFLIHIKEEFYGGEKIPVSQIGYYIKGATIVNAIGNNVVAELARIISAVKYAAVEIGGVLHVQLLLK